MFEIVLKIFRYLLPCFIGTTKCVLLLLLVVVVAVVVVVVVVVILYFPLCYTKIYKRKYGVIL